MQVATPSKPKPYDVMVDIETLGVTESAPVLSIGAVLFDADGEGTVGEPFHVHLEVSDNVEGEKIEVGAVLWWLQQGEAARKLVTDATRLPVATCLEQFIAFASQGLEDPSQVRMWANSPSFDFILLRACLKRHAPELKWPFSPFVERDVRTALRLTRTRVDRSGLTSHSALDDAIMQSRAVQEAKKKARRASDSDPK